jgi:hypothetical protein
MYALLTTALFRVLTDSGPLQYTTHPPITIRIFDINGNPVLNASEQPMYVVPTPTGQAKQAMIGAHFNHARL